MAQEIKPDQAAVDAERVVDGEARERFLIAIRSDLDLVEPHAIRRFRAGPVDAAEVLLAVELLAAEADRGAERYHISLELVRQDHEEVVARIEPDAGQHLVLDLYRHPRQK